MSLGGCALVTIDWLNQSIEQKKPANVRHFELKVLAVQTMQVIGTSLTKGVKRMSEKSGLDSVSLHVNPAYLIAGAATETGEYCLASMH